MLLLAAVVGAACLPFSKSSVPLPKASADFGVISIALLFVYLLYLVFILVTHSTLFAGSGHAGEEKTQVSVAQASAVLGGATAGIVWMSELLVVSIEPTAHEFRS